jgi:hypothetical protein
MFVHKSPVSGFLRARERGGASILTLCGAPTTNGAVP